MIDYHQHYNTPHNADSAKVEPINTLAKLDKSVGEWWTHEEMRIVRQLLDDKDKRITELEAALAAASQWQPLPDGEYSVDGVNPSYRLSVSGGNLAAGWARSVNMDEIFIGEYRLFRRTPAAGADHAS